MTSDVYDQRALRDWARAPVVLPMRRDGWERYLDAWVRRALTTPFSWGHWDCCLSVCTCVRMMTGFDPASELRGRYETKEKAYRLIAKITKGKDVEDIARWVAERYGYPETDTPRSGDVCVVNHQGGKMLGIYVTHGVIVTGTHGAQTVPHSAILRSWIV